MEKKVKITAQINTDLKKRIEDLAEGNLMSESSLVRLILHDFFKQRDAKKRTLRREPSVI